MHAQPLDTETVEHWAARLGAEGHVAGLAQRALAHLQAHQVPLARRHHHLPAAPAS